VIYFDIDIPELGDQRHNKNRVDPNKNSVESVRRRSATIKIEAYENPKP
jgi:hypothetical protein